MMQTEGELFSIRRWVFLGTLTVLLLIGGVGLWAARAPLASALILSGTVTPATAPAPVQHATGGRIAEVFAREGEQLAAGTLIARFETEDAQRALGEVELALFETRAREARLQAQFDRADRVTFPSEAPRHPNSAQVIQRERAAFVATRKAKAAMDEQLRQQKAQQEARQEGIIVQKSAAARQKELIERALEDQNALLSRGLSPAATVLRLQKELAVIDGRLGALDAQSRETETALQEISARRIAFGSEQKSETAEAIAALRPRMHDLERQASTLRQEIAGADILAPVGGVLHDMTLHHAGQVIPPGATIAQLLPTEAQNKVRAALSPGARDEVHIGQQALLRLTAWNTALSLEVPAEVTRISAAPVPFDSQNQPQFELELTLQDTDQPLPALLPGMPVEVLVYTGERTALAYLIKPFADYLARAMRES